MKCYGLKYLKSESDNSVWSDVYAVSNDPKKLRAICKGVDSLGWYVRGGIVEHKNLILLPILLIIIWMVPLKIMDHSIRS